MERIEVEDVRDESGDETGARMILRSACLTLEVAGYNGAWSGQVVTLLESHLDVVLESGIDHREFFRPIAALVAVCEPTEFAGGIFKRAEDVNFMVVTIKQHTGELRQKLNNRPSGS
jgi:hypothetical protein